MHEIIKMTENEKNGFNDAISKHSFRMFIKNFPECQNN